MGVELDQWSANGHNGKVKGRTYFKASPGCGMFARRSSILKLDISPESLGIDQVSLPDSGDRVRLKDGQIAVVQVCAHPFDGVGVHDERRMHLVMCSM